MPAYRYHPSVFSRRYMNQNFNGYTPEYSKSDAGNSERDEISDNNDLKKAFQIPMPNEAEEIPDKIERETSVEAAPRRLQTSRQSFIDIFKNRIHIDDIILIGLIFLLLDNEFKDDFLLILLLYIFLF